MHIITVLRLREFEKKHGDCSTQLRTWEQIMKHNRFENAAKLAAAFPSVRGVKNDRFVFKIKGNDYRLIVWIKFEVGRVYIRWIGTHAEYDKINADTV